MPLFLPLIIFQGSLSANKLLLPSFQSNGGCFLEKARDPGDAGLLLLLEEEQGALRGRMRVWVLRAPSLSMVMRSGGEGDNNNPSRSGGGDGGVRIRIRINVFVGFWASGRRSNLDHHHHYHWSNAYPVRSFRSALVASRWSRRWQQQWADRALQTRGFEARPARIKQKMMMMIIIVIVISRRCAR